MSAVPDSTTGKVPPKPGILFVASKVLNIDVLDPLDFIDWYENTHIQEVQSTGGISSTQRYESLSFHKCHRDSNATAAENANFDFEFLTIYNMPDLAFRETAAFKGLDGQSKPSDELLEKLFKQTAFTTRFCEESEPVAKNDKPVIFLATVCWRSDAHDPEMRSKLSKIEGLRSMREFEVREGSLLRKFERSWESEPTSIVLLEFEDGKGLFGIQNAIGASQSGEIGLWRLRREYQGSERKPAGWKPK
jgi:hypothetical protein